MAARQKRKSLPSKSLTSVEEAPLIKEPPTTPVVKEDPRNVILKELLENLLPYVTIKTEINKSFARLLFKNTSSYCGWLGPHGFQGFGTYTYYDGACFRGTFEGSLTRGLGRFIYKRGSTYEGEFLGGHRHGYGKYKTRRFHYEGYFKNGLFHGQGVWKSKTEEQKGVFYEGKITHGEVYDHSGSFKGKFDESDLRQHGKLTFKNGDTYNGSWADDLFCGYGVYNWVKEGVTLTNAQTKYVGYWLKGQRYACGMLTFQQRFIICQWGNDKKNGAGVIIACNGNCYAGANMFKHNEYNGSLQIKLCKESRELLLYIFKLTTPQIQYETMEEKRDVLMTKITELMENHGEWFCPMYPIRIPPNEIVSLPSDLHKTAFEVKFLQQVLLENYGNFEELYNKYTHPDDDYMNNLGLNLFYMDLFSKVRDVNVFDLLEAGNCEIRHQCVLSEETKSCVSHLAVVPFYEFIQHFIRITEILVLNEKINLAAQRLKPTFFGTLATQVLYVLKMLQVHQLPPFLVREALLVNRPAILNLLHVMKEQSYGDKTIRKPYRYLRSKGVISGPATHFVQAVSIHFENEFEDGIMSKTEHKFSALELVEIVLYTCQLKLAQGDMKKNKQLEQQYKKDLIKNL